MKKLVTAIALSSIMFSSQAMATDLGYMINPPKERAISEIRADLDQATRQGNKPKIAELQRELAQTLQSVQPAAGDKAPVNPYGHLLAH